MSRSNRVSFFKAVVGHPRCQRSRAAEGQPKGFCPSQQGQPKYNNNISARRPYTLVAPQAIVSDLCPAAFTIKGQCCTSLWNYYRYYSIVTVRLFQEEGSQQWVGGNTMSQELCQLLKRSTPPLTPCHQVCLCVYLRAHLISSLRSIWVMAFYIFNFVPLR